MNLHIVDRIIRVLDAIDTRYANALNEPEPEQENMP